jgi:hypothetical protein
MGKGDKWLFSWGKLAAVVQWVGETYTIFRRQHQPTGRLGNNPASSTLASRPYFSVDRPQKGWKLERIRIKQRRKNRLGISTCSFGLLPRRPGQGYGAYAIWVPPHVAYARKLLPRILLHPTTRSTISPSVSFLVPAGRASRP